MGDTIEERITAIAERQHGVVQRRQLLAAGVTSDMVASRLASGGLRRVHPGVYLLGQLRGPLEPPLATETAAVLACPPGVLVSRRSAAGLLDLAPRPTQGITPRPSRGVTPRPSRGMGERRADPIGTGNRRRRPVDIAFPDGRTPTRLPGIRAHRAGTLEPGDASVVQGVPVTSPARTILDLAAVATSRELERAVARAERLGLVDAGDLEALVGRSRGRRGARLLRSVIQRDGGALLTRSEAESRFVDLVRGTGLPPPEANVLIEGYEVDFLWREQRVAVEVDGFAYHRSRRSFVSDRRRDAELLGIGIRTMRVTWGQIVDEPKQTLVRLVRALGGGAGFPDD